MEFEIRPTRYGAPAAQRLVAEIMEDLTVRYGGGDDTPVAAVEFDPPDGGFFVAYSGRAPVGCGAWRSWAGADDIAEIKRVYVVPEARGRGLARRIMATIEEDAREHGRKRIILETGLGQPEAIALYHALGYEAIEPFGHYKDSPAARGFGKDL